MRTAGRDAAYMAMALRLAARARGNTSPNPMVGAVVVSGRRIVGQGYHQRPGGPHAERIALESAGHLAKGATLYVTLEPCCHTRKRTPPCVPLLIQSGLHRVVIAMRDPNPQVHGRGIRRLRRAGVEARVGCLRDQAERLNEAYIHWIRTGRPFVVLKAGMTLDGKIATASGESHWITSEEARRDAHRLRRQSDAIMVGIETVLRDDPRLTARILRNRSEELARRQPLRIVVDSRLRIPPHAKVLSSKPRAKALVATTDKAPQRRIDELRARGVTVLVLPTEEGKVSLKTCLNHLAKRGVTSLVLEGGGELNATALRTGLVNRVRLYVAPTLLGGRDAKAVIGGVSPKRLADAIGVHDFQSRRIGRDLLLEGQISPRTTRSRR